jgi:hypothetical protein
MHSPCEVYAKAWVVQEFFLAKKVPRERGGQQPVYLQMNPSRRSAMETTLHQLNSHGSQRIARFPGGRVWLPR